MTLMKLLIEILFPFKFDQLKVCIHYSLVIIIGLARIYNLRFSSNSSSLLHFNLKGTVHLIG